MTIFKYIFSLILLNEIRLTYLIFKRLNNTFKKCSALYNNFNVISLFTLFIALLSALSIGFILNFYNVKQNIVLLYIRFDRNLSLYDIKLHIFFPFSIVFFT